jgi:flavodoxin
MKFLVVYFSRGGKTRKVAMTIAHELGCETIDLAEESPDLSRTGFLVVGSGNYGGMPRDKILDFLKVLPEMSGGKAAVFATSGGPNPKGIPAMGRSWRPRATKSSRVTTAAASSRYSAGAIRQMMI